MVSTHKGESISRREKEKKERRQLEAERIRALGTRRLEEDASRIVNLPTNEREAGLIYTCKKSVLLGVEPISNLSTKKWRAAFWGEMQKGELEVQGEMPVVSVRQYTAKKTKNKVVGNLGITLTKDAYISKRMLRVGTSDDARVSTVVNTPKGRDNIEPLSAVITLTVQCSLRA